MSWDKVSACNALMKGWEAMGFSDEVKKRAHAKCMTNYRRPKKKRPPKKKRRG